MHVRMDDEEKTQTSEEEDVTALKVVPAVGVSDLLTSYKLAVWLQKKKTDGNLDIKNYGKHCKIISYSSL